MLAFERLRFLYLLKGSLYLRAVTESHSKINPNKQMLKVPMKLGIFHRNTDFWPFCRFTRFYPALPEGIHAFRFCLVHANNPYSVHDYKPRTKYKLLDYSGKGKHCPPSLQLLKGLKGKNGTSN